MSRHMKAKRDRLVSVPDVATAKGWSYARAYDAVLRHEFGIPLRADRCRSVPEEAVAGTK